MASKKHIHSSRAKIKRRRVFLFKFSVGVTFLVLLISGIIYLGNASFFEVSSVEIVGASVVSVSSIEQEVLSSASGKRFAVFSKMNTFLFPKEKIQNEVLGSFKRIEDISISRNGLNSMTISVKERESAYIWCESTESEFCYFIDRNGFVFDVAPTFSANPYFIFYGTLTENPIGITAISGKEIDYIESFISGIKILELPFGQPDSLAVRSPGDFILNFGEEFQIFFDTDENAERVIENIYIAVQNGGIRNRLPELSYIDARFGNKIFFK